MVMTLEQLDVSFKCNRNKPIHRWYHFHAGCSSEFPEKMIDLLRIKSGATILDPFAGSGTILVVTKERGINSVGFDLNPFYVFMARVKTYWEFDTASLFDQIQLLSARLEARRYLIHKESTTLVDNIPPYIWRYFDAEILKQLSVLKEVVLEVEMETLRNLLLLALSSILIDVSKVHYVGETIVFDKAVCTSGINVEEVFMEKVWEMYSDLETKQRMTSMSHVETKVEDARNLISVPDGSLDHVVTHPPYLNNYNYLLHDRLPMFFLEYFKTLSDEKKMRTLIMGSVDSNKPSAKLSEIPIVQDIAKKVKKTRDKERYDAIIEYCSSMSLFFRNLHDKLREDGYCAMLVGNSYVRGVMVPLDVIIAKIAEQNGFLVVANSVVRDRGNGAFQHLYNGKLYESIVVLKRI